MNRIKTFTVALMVAIVFLLTGCTFGMKGYDFEVISTKKIDLSKIGKLEKSNQRVTGKSSAPIILTVMGKPKFSEAVDMAINSVPGAVALADVVTREGFWWVLLFGQTSYIVEGTPLIDPSKK